MNNIKNLGGMFQKFILVLEEEVIPTQDFLSFHAQCLSVLESDKSLIGVSAWNENGLPVLTYSDYAEMF